MQNRITVIIGKKGSGKSFLANKLSKKVDKIIIADPLNEYSGGHVFYSFDEFELRIYELATRPRFRIICKFSRDDDFVRLFDFIFNMNGITFLCDESDMFASARRIYPEFSRLISYGRHRNLDLILISRRPYELNALIRSQTDLWIVFKQTEMRDLEYIKSIGINPDDVISLGKYKYLERLNE